MRDVHLALVRTIDAEGSQLSRLLVQTYRVYNAEHFDGQLGEPCLLLTSPNSPRALGDYIGKDEQGIESRIRIRPTLVKRGLRYVQDVVLHEMIHAAVAEIDKPTGPAAKTEATYKGHGPIFTARANAIGAKLGLPPVFVKGRGGPDSSHWPLNVRPSDFYQEPSADKDDKKAPAKPRKQAKNGATKEPEPMPVLENIAALLEAGEDPEDLLDELAQAQEYVLAFLSEREETEHDAVESGHPKD